MQLYRTEYTADGVPCSHSNVVHSLLQAAGTLQLTSLPPFLRAHGSFDGDTAIWLHGDRQYALVVMGVVGQPLRPTAFRKTCLLWKWCGT